MFLSTDKKVFCLLINLRSKPLNVRSEPLNVRSKPLNGDFICGLTILVDHSAHY